MILDSEALYFHAMKVKVFLVSGDISLENRLVYDKNDQQFFL